MGMFYFYTFFTEKNIKGKNKIKGQEQRELVSLG